MATDQLARGLAAGATKPNILLPALTRTIGIISPIRAPLYKYIHIGDSLTQGSSDEQVHAFGSTDMVWQTAMRSDGVLMPMRNAGVGGQPSAMIAARFMRDVIKYAPDVVGVTLGTNDVIIFNASTYILPSLESIHTEARSAGVFYFLTTIPPYASRAALVTEINGIISGFCAENNVPLVDWYALANDPANPGSWKTNWSYDGTHPTQRTSDRFAQLNWSAIAPYLISTRKQQHPEVQSPANLLFPPSGISNTGMPAVSTEREGLFLNYRSFSQNGYTAITPRMYDVMSTAVGLAPTVSAEMEQVEGFSGNVWKITASANAGGAGAMTFAMLHNVSSPIIDVRKYQGRRVYLGFAFGTEGFDAINTDAYFAANSNALKVSVGVGVGLRDIAGNPIGGTFIVDPVDPLLSLGTSSNISMQWGVALWNQTSGYRHGYDMPLTRVIVPMNIPPGAHSMNLSHVIRFFAGGIGPIIFRTAEFFVMDAGPAEYPALVVNNDPLRYLKITASTTLSRSDLLSYDAILVDATLAAVTVALPSATVLFGMRILVKRLDGSGNAVTIDPNGAETIDGAATYALTAQWQAVSMFVDNGAWLVTSTV